MKRLISLILVLSLLVGCGSATVAATEKFTQTVYAMDTVMSLTAYGPAAEEGLQKAATEIERLEHLLSTTDTGSDIWTLNDQGAALVDGETGKLIQRALEAAQLSDGDFDPTLGCLMELWGFRSNGSYQVPVPEELEKALEAAGYWKVSLEETETGYTATVPDGCHLDLGGIAKGYTSQQVLEQLAQAGVTSAVVSLGGNVGTLGQKPDGSLWTVAVQDPSGEDSYIATLTLGGQEERWYAITSGAYERYFEQDGVRYHHILDPSTGYPADSDLLSVTVVSQDGTLADALSTALFVKGLQGALDFWRANSQDFDLILVTEAELYVTGDLSVSSQLDIQRVEVTS
jgi:thiamine biosynthesis lipoprotein